VQEEFEILENFKRDWPGWPKDQVLEGSCVGGKRWFGFAHEASLQIFSSLMIGRRGGVWEELTVVDRAKKTLIDQLVMHDTTTSTGFLLDLTSIRYEVRLGKNLGAVSLRCVSELVNCAVTKPEEFLSWVKRVTVPTGPRRSISSTRIVPGCYGRRQ
jgi:hypothetical protein